MRVIFIGSGDIGIPSLRWLLEHHEVVALVAQPDKPVGRKQLLTPPPTKPVAQAHGIPVLQPRRIREPEAVAAIEALRPEVIVVMAYGQILPKGVLEAPSLACLNLHASLLPRHRGAAPIQAAIEAGEPRSGITVIWMDEGLDTGDCLLERALPIRRRETGGTLHDRLALLAPGALADALAALERGDAPRVPQEEALATLAPKLSRESGLIDWRATPREIDRRVRAMNPWPAAWTWLPEGGAPPRRLKIFSVIAHRRLPPHSRPPGEVLRADERGVLVAAGEGGAVLLRDLQMEGKRRMPAGEWLRGYPVPPGTRLGEQA